MRNAARGVAFALSLALSGRVADAAVVVDNFTGAKKTELRDAVLSALAQDNHDVSQARATQVAPSSDDDAYARRAAEDHATAFIDGDAKQKKTGWVLTLTVRNGADGKVLGTTILKSAKLAGLMKKIDEEAATRLEPSLDQASAPEPKAKADAGDKAETAEAVSKEKSEPDESEAEEPHEKRQEPSPEEHGRSPVPLELWAGMQGFSRSFEYHQDVNGSLHPYHLPFWPALEARAGWYPGAHFTRNMAANFGVVLGIVQSLGASSAVGEGKTYGTNMRELTAAARFRLPIAEHELGVSFGYGSHRFDIDADRDPLTVAANGLTVNRNYVPDSSYRYLRPGLDARLSFGRLQFGAGLGYRVILGLGELTAAPWFPHATAQALDGFVFGGYEVSPGFYVTAGFDATRYALDMHTTLADRAAARDIAGGAVDQYLTGHLGVEFRLGQTRAGSSEWRVSERATRAGSD